MPELTFTVNNRLVHLEIDPSAMLVDVLREDLGLTGTKIGCREGECGACTVLFNGMPVNSCLLPAPKAQNGHIITVEGLGTATNPHPLQAALAEHGAIQCGYCTPGMVMSAVALLARTPHPTEEDIRLALAGNLCRCTGYSKIIQAIKLVAAAQSVGTE
jgi:aerobic-type carbon monoxide dehydrogenase small subunit (CoxS/CutS family)